MVGLENAKHELSTVLSTTGTVESTIRAYLTHLVADDEASTLVQQVTRDTPRPDPAQDRVEQLRRELPPRTSNNRKTHGQWFAGNGPARPLVSGEDQDAQLAKGYLAGIGEDRAVIRAHVEIKLAARIRQRHERSGRTTNVTLVINNEICQGDKSCPVYLPWLLPPDSSITVITPTARQTFTGDAT